MSTEDLADPNKATIAELGLGMRTYNALRRAGYSFVEELMRCSEQDLLKLRNMGKRNVEEIRKALRLSQQQISLLSTWSLNQRQCQSEAYDLLTRIENNVRRFIRHTLQNFYGKFWWGSGMPVYIQHYVGNRMKSMPLQYSVNDRMEFADFPDYKNIIADDANWNSIFSVILGPKTQIVEHLVRINHLRRSIAHTRPIEPQALDELRREAKFAGKTFRIKRRTSPIQ